MPSWTGVILCGFALHTTACGGQRGDGNQALSTCLRDLWLSPVVISCDCIGGTPECGAADCDERKFMWLGRTDFAAEGFLEVSWSRGTFSSLGAPLTYPYTVADGKLTIVGRGTGAAYPAACAETSLNWGGVLYDRAPAGMSDSLDRNWGSGTGWKAIPVRP